MCDAGAACAPLAMHVCFRAHARWTCTHACMRACKDVGTLAGTPAACLPTDAQPHLKRTASGGDEGQRHIRPRHDGQAPFGCVWSVCVLQCTHALPQVGCMQAARGGRGELAGSCALAHPPSPVQLIQGHHGCCSCCREGPGKKGLAREWFSHPHSYHSHTVCAMMDPPTGGGAGPAPSSSSLTLLQQAQQLQQRREEERQQLNKTQLKKTRRKLSKLYHKVRLCVLGEGGVCATCMHAVGRHARTHAITHARTHTCTCMHAMHTPARRCMRSAACKPSRLRRSTVPCTHNNRPWAGARQARRPPAQPPAARSRPSPPARSPPRCWPALGVV